MTSPISRERISVKMYSPLGVLEAHQRESASLPLRIIGNKIVTFFPEDDEFLTARVTPLQAEYLLSIPGFSTDGSDYGARPSTGIQSWHEEGASRVSRNRANLEEQARSAPSDLISQLFSHNPELSNALIQALAGKLAGGASVPTAPAVVTHNFDIYEMMDLVDLEEASILIEEFDISFDFAVAPRSAVYTRLVRLADENATLFERLNRRRNPSAPVEDQDTE